MNKLLSIVLSYLLVFSVFTPNIYAAVVKSSNKKGAKKDKSDKSKNLDRIKGKAGALNESKTAMISVDPLALQNYSQTNNNFDFTDYPKITLKSAILETLSNSNVLKTAQEKVIQIKLQLKDAYAGYLPTVDFQYSLKDIHNIETGNNGIDKPSHLHYKDENYKLSLRQSVYSGGSTSYKIKTLKAKVKEANRKFQIVLEKDIQKAIKAYFGVLFSYKNVKINEKNMVQLNKILEITQIKYDSGALSIGDLSAIKANIANASGKLIKIKSELADAVDYYQYTLGKNFERTAPFQDEFNMELGTLEDIDNDILQNNLALLNYRGSISSTKDKLMGIKATFKPKVDLELTYKNILDKEDFETNEESYYAKVTMAYNIYNGGKDTTKTLQTYSSLKELKHRYNEEVRKIQWETKKLYNSIKSLDKTLKSTKEEVSASVDMVDAYWEGFQLGEQDLNVLLQGQRQLNGAQLDLLKYKQDYLTNLFKLIKNKGKLAQYFGIDKKSPDFLDFTATQSIDSNINLDLTQKTKKDSNITQVTEAKFDLNTTIDEYLEVTNEPTFEDIINFKDSFLESDDENYTIAISKFTNNYDAYKYIKQNRMLENAFSYEYIDKNGELISKKKKTKLVDVRTNIAHGIYNSKEDAQNAIDNILPNQDEKKYSIVKTKDIKAMYNKYIDGLETKIDPYIIKPKKKKIFRTDAEFKNKFLNAPEHYFTINVVSFSKIKHAQNLIKEENIQKESIVFRYGRKGEWIKVMYGIYPTYEEALVALRKHPKMISKYQPIIERIVHKQKLFNKYKEYNKEPKKPKEVSIPKKVIVDKPITKEENIIKKPLIIKEKAPKIEFKSDDYTSYIEAIKNAPKNFYTITVAILPNEKAISYIKKYFDDNNYATIKTDKNNIQIIKGLYKDRPSAINAKNNLHPKLIKSSYLNTMKRINLNNIIKLDMKDNKNDIIDIQNNIDNNISIETNTSIVIPKIGKNINTNPIVKQDILRSNNSVFTKALLNAPDSFYTITLAILPEYKAIKFINGYIKDNKYATIKTKKNNIQIVHGLYKNRTIAKENGIKSLKPWLKKEAYLSSVKRLSKNNIVYLDNNISSNKTDLQILDTINKVKNEDLNNNSSEYFNKNDYSSFEEALKKAPKSYFTITLANLQRQDVKEFISQYIFDDDYATIQNKKDTIQIIQGIYEDRLNANDSITDLHPSIINKAYLSKIGSLSLNNIISMNKEKSTQEIEIPNTNNNVGNISTEKDLLSKRLIKAKKNAYTITLIKLSKPKAIKFIKKYLNNNNDYATLLTKKGNIQIVQGLFDNRKNALKAIQNLHPGLTKNAYLSTVKKLPINNLINLNSIKSEKK